MNLLVRLLVMMMNEELSMEAISKTLRGNKKKIFDAITSLTSSQEKILEKKFGSKILDIVKDSVKKKAGKSTSKSNAPIPYTPLPNSSWIAGIAWNPKLKLLILKVKTGKAKTYELPFFPGAVAHRMLTNKSPGKTLWNGYWRVYGKGKVSNKAKNLIKVSIAKSAQKKINKLVPKITLPSTLIPKEKKRVYTYKTRTKAKKKVVSTRLIKGVKIKTANIPKTGAKGIRITIKAPGINRRK